MASVLAILSAFIVGDIVAMLADWEDALVWSVALVAAETSVDV